MPLVGLEGLSGVLPQPLGKAALLHTLLVVSGGDQVRAGLPPATPLVLPPAHSLQPAPLLARAGHGVPCG